MAATQKYAQIAHAFYNRNATKNSAYERTNLYIDLI